MHFRLTYARGTSEYLVFSQALDLAKERKLRIWFEFWDVLFIQDEDLRIPHNMGPDSPGAMGDDDVQYVVALLSVGTYSF